MFGNPFQLRSTLSASSRNNENDIRNAKQAFSSLGYVTLHARQSSKQSDDTLFGGVRRFQSDHGLKRDGVMQPNGETERMLGKVLVKRRNGAGKFASSLVATPELDQKPSLLDTFPSRTHDRSRVGEATQGNEKLLELIAKKARDNEVIAESARTVKAALQTSNHTESCQIPCPGR